jgi:hypothetical protein
MSSPTLDPFRDRFAALKQPVIVFNKSHSGSRMLAQFLNAAGVFVGSHLNESWDSVDVLELVEFLVTRYYPDYSPLWDAHRPPDLELARLLDKVFARHLQGFDVDLNRPWGWKLCETVYALPVLDYCFPGARFVHLIRDGRDVAFCDHKAPDSGYWRKVYFNTDRIETYAGLRLTAPAYRRQSHIFNAIHWVNSVSLGRTHGALLRDRYTEVRYEDLCRDFVRAAPELLKVIGVESARGAVESMLPAIRESSIGKYETHSKQHQDRVLRIEKPLLLSLGYLEHDPEPRAGSLWRSHLADRLVDGWKTRSKRLS